MKTSSIREDQTISKQLFINNLKSSYTNSKLAILWDIADPLLYALIFVFLKKSQALSIGSGGMSYSLFAVSGLMIWKSFSDGLLIPFSLLKKHASIVESRSISYRTFIMLALMEASFYHCIRISIVCILALFLEGFSLFFFLFIIASFTPILLGIGLGFCLAPFNSVLEDIEKITKILIMPMMFVSGVIAPAPKIGGMDFNPVSNIISNLRFFITDNPISFDLFTIISYSLSFVFFVLGVFVYKRTFKFSCERL